MLAVLLALAATGVQGQELTVEGVFGSGEYFPDRMPSVSWTPDGSAFTWIQPSQAGGTDLLSHDVRSGETRRLIDGSRLVPPGERSPVELEGYDWSPDGTKLLIYTRTQRVWRQNTKGIYFVYDLASGGLQPVSTRFGWQQFAKFSPDGTRVGFVRDNDLWVTELATGVETRLTRDGSENIINGTFDWVYEEELGLRDGWRWSPDGRKIAFWRLDQTPIKTFYMIDDLELYPEPVPIRYPKAGEANSLVQVGVVDVEGGETRWMDLGENPDVYVARMEWAGRSDELVLQRLNRHQNRLEIMLFGVSSGVGRVIVTENSDAWVDVDDDFVWLASGRFVWSSDRDGYNHLYLYQRDGSLARQLTRGSWDVDGVVGVDEAGGWVYYRAARESPLDRALYRAPLGGGDSELLTPGGGTHEIELAPGGTFFLDSYATAGSPPAIALFEGNGRRLRVLTDNQRLREKLAAMRLRAPEFFTFTTSDGVELNGWMIKPPDFDASRQYPVLMYVYGGPGSQTVTNDWGGSRYLWHQLLAQRGYIVASVDNRGTGGRGRDFYKVTYRKLGEWESHDQVEAAGHLATLPYVDASRIGIWGWSYGGYMTLLSLMRGGDVFRAGISVAPVTDWEFYDTIYTERYMRTPRENPAGYRDGAPIHRVDGMTGDLLLVHGTGDDNVHFQNTVQLVHALQEAGKQFDLMIYPNKTHSISGVGTQQHLYTMMLEWLRENLPSEGGRPVS